MACPIFTYNDTSQNTCFCAEYLNANYEDELFNNKIGHPWLVLYLHTITRLKIRVFTRNIWTQIMKLNSLTVKWGIHASAFTSTQWHVSKYLFLHGISEHTLWTWTLFTSRWDMSCTMQLNVRLCSHLYDVSGDGVHNKVIHSRMPSGYHNQHQLGIHRVRRRQ
jgi:hypothetical protein